MGADSRSLRGILLGVKDNLFEAESWDFGTYFVGVTIRNRISNIRGEVVIVYGPADHQWSQNFLDELDIKCNESRLPILVGGDFNLIRDPTDKSSGKGDTRLTEAFNTFIEKHSLKELQGGHYTWTNKQENLVQSNIDMVLVSTEWDLKLPLSSLNTLTRVGSDHCPLLLDTEKEVGGEKGNRQFHFEKQWDKIEGFRGLVRKKWGETKDKCPAIGYSLDI